MVMLRPLEAEDLDLLYQWENNPTVWEVSHTLSPYSKFVLQQYLDQSQLDIYTTKQLRLVIMDIENNKPVGLVDFFDFDPFHMRTGIGVLIAQESDRRKGFAKEAIRLMLKYASKHLKLNQVYCNIAANNLSSLNLFEQLGFHKVGVKQQWLNTADGYQDEYLLQLIF